MSKKVKITKEQAKSIEWLRERQSEKYGHLYSDEKCIKDHIKMKEKNGKWTKEMSGLNDMTTMNLIDALRVGYEVEVKFGDSKYFHSNFGKTGILHEHHIYWEGGGTTGLLYAKSDFIDNWIRHATEDEIEQYKKNRIWRNLNRRVGEFKTGDRGINKEGSYILTPKLLEVYYNKGELDGFYPIDSYVKLN